MSGPTHAIAPTESVERPRPKATTEIAFAGTSLQAFKEGDEIYTCLKRACENLGLDYGTQLKKLKKSPWATMVDSTIVDPSGASRATWCISHKSLPMWLATIHQGKVKAALQNRLIQYQKEASTVLYRHFFPATNREVVLAPQSISQPAPSDPHPYVEALAKLCTAVLADNQALHQALATTQAKLDHLQRQSEDTNDKAHQAALSTRMAQIDQKRLREEMVLNNETLNQVWHALLDVQDTLVQLYHA